MFIFFVKILDDLEICSRTSCKIDACYRHSQIIIYKSVYDLRLPFGPRAIRFNRSGILSPITEYKSQ